MLRAIAIDDEPRALEVLTQYCAQVPFLSLEATFRDPVGGLDWLMAHPADLVFLDINMPGLSGIELSKLLDGKVMVVFTTAYSEYAVESYQVKALDYLVKPIPFDRFLQAAQRARELHTLQQHQPGQSGPEPRPATPTRSSTLFVKSGNRHHRIDTDEIRFVEKDGNYATFHLADQKIVTRHTIQQLLELLPSEGFMQVHKSYIVAIRHIDVVEPTQLTIGGHPIPVARNYREDVQQLTSGS